LNVLLLDSLQRPSQQTLQKSLNKDAVYQTYYDRYIEFCTAVNIPCFPISLSTITLFLYAKCSYQNGNFASAIAYLKRARTETIILWENIQGVDDLEDSAAIAIALQQFRKERKGLRLKSLILRLYWLTMIKLTLGLAQLSDRRRNVTLLKPTLPTFPMLQTTVTTLRLFIRVAFKRFRNL